MYHGAVFRVPDARRAVPGSGDRLGAAAQPFRSRYRVVMSCQGFLGRPHDN